MGLLVKGEWQDKWYDTKASGGHFIREDAQFRSQIGDPEFPAEAGRYALYVSLACPWAHRTLIFRALKSLQAFINVVVVSPIMLEQGWTFNTQEGSSGDHYHQFDYLHQLYTLNQADYSGRVTVPVLWDSLSKRIVNNESSEIIRQLNTAFNALTGNRTDYYPEAWRHEIDEINAEVYQTINNGVYRCGFATSQSAYEEAYGQLFSALDGLETRLSKQRYLVGDHPTEADWRLFTTLIRFDAVYHGHFKCNRQRLSEFESLSDYMRELYQWPGVAETTNFDHIKRHYYVSHKTINPTGIVPKGPELDFTAAHSRERLWL